MEVLQKHLNQIMNERNNKGIPEFEGYSPFDVQNIIYDTFELNNPIQLQKLTDTDYKSIPLLNQIKYLTNIIAKNGEIKLTSKGFLPTKIVSELYAQGFIKDELIEKGISKLYKETDADIINLTRILIEISGLTKKRNGKLSLTKAAEKTLSDDFLLLKLIFINCGSKFNWAYYDRYGNNQIGQLGYGFSLILLSKYGQERRLDRFYADKYFKAFPKLIEDSINADFGIFENQIADCYSLRTFDRFLDYFGLIKIELSSHNWDADKFVTKTDLFDKMIKCKPSN